MRRLISLCLAPALGLALPQPLGAEPLPVVRAAPVPTAPPAPPILQRRMASVVAVLRGQAGDLNAIFTPALLAQVPPAQFAALRERLAAQYGAVTGIEAVEPVGSGGARLRIGLERAVLNIALTLEPDAPNRISGLVITSAEPRGDTMAAIMQDLRALPGQVTFAMADLGDTPGISASIDADRPMAVGSSIKLVVLAELSRQIQAGRRRWSDVVPIDRRSQPTGSLHTWPQGAPITLHTLATLMISISDNTATDILIHTLGRTEVEAMMERVGWQSAARNQPLLTTLEFFALKAGPAELLPAWRAGDEAARRRLVDGPLGAVTAEQIDISRLTGRPNAIDTAEWFASPADLVRVMDWLRRSGDETARAILAVSPGATPSLVRDFAYIGFKGGSETGVISLTWLVRTRAGRWRVVTGSWTNPEAAVDEARFGALMQRALLLVR